jgi:hypothetical protein
MAPLCINARRAGEGAKDDGVGETKGCLKPLVIPEERERILIAGLSEPAKREDGWALNSLEQAKPTKTRVKISGEEGNIEVY